MVWREILRLQDAAVFSPAAVVPERTTLAPALHAGCGRAGDGEYLVAELADFAADDGGVAVDGYAPCVDWTAEVVEAAGGAGNGAGADILAGEEGYQVGLFAEGGSCWVGEE